MRRRGRAPDTILQPRSTLVRLPETLRQRPGQALADRIGPALTSSLDDRDPVIEYSGMLRHLAYDPSYGGGSRSVTTSIDNSRSVVVQSPQVDPGLTDKQKAEVRELYTRMRLEEGLIE